MDYKFVEILSKEELLKILIERKLDLPNMQEMSHSELIHIYKTFALPLARREKNRTRNKPAINSVSGSLNVGGGVVLMDIDELSESMHFPSNKTSSTASPFSERYTTCAKNPREYKRVNPLTDEYLSIATKRIKIALT
ncbi:uncharacterized protein LOC101455515 [Ceratitis capitata]|uniref:Uncharacterized protein n=1 Tax=Ceratitis capitata TaxID=7213 RepID=W8AN86_CERCA|nr:uncharacterized protein LOC101455515 [Ceratitis capitata]